jgi:AAA+ superfamily predicted ATPase
MTIMSPMIEKGLKKLVNVVLDTEAYIDDDHYQKVSFRVYSENIINGILHKFKFVEVGNVYDFPNVLPQPETVDGFDLTNNYDFFQKIAVSEKINSVAFYSIDRYSIECVFLVDTDYLKKFSKKTKPILQQDSGANMFRNINFKCKERQYIEVSDATGDSMKPADVVKKKVNKENLVFEENSTIYMVMRDIMTFFEDKTKDLYGKMEIAYKRGIILYGDPGNGKSAMIREIIRQIPHITKIVINPNVGHVTRILSALIKSLNGKQAIVIIEDIDSLITSRNRSEFLNILDGVDIQSGVYFIGTTNYPEHIDPAFMNRSGRFDRTYKIDNPSDETRRAYFESKNIGELLGEYKVFIDDTFPDSDEAVVDLFVKFSKDLPMASLKEIMTGTQYALASDPNKSIEEALEATYNMLTNNKKDHKNAHDLYLKRDRMAEQTEIDAILESI